MASKPLSHDDIAHFLHHTPDIWQAFEGARIFMTGGTGFIGKWLVETFLAANDAYSLGASVMLLSRRPVAFAAEMPHIAASTSVELLEGDVRDFTFPAESFTHVIHAATDVAAASAPLETFNVTVNGTRRVMELCRASHVRKLLMISSGAIYGRQPPHLASLAETFDGAPPTTDIGAAYAQGKRAAEWLACAEADAMGCHLSIARCFAFVGPHLPLDKQFAIGNFMADVMHGRDIGIGGDGRAVRSYLHAADMAAWLWTILAQGRHGAAYNVGSDQAVSIADLARAITTACAATATRVSIAKTPVEGELPHRYVPAIDRARQELGLDVWIPLEDSIRRTVKWHSDQEVVL